MATKETVQANGTFIRETKGRESWEMGPRREHAGRGGRGGEAGEEKKGEAPSSSADARAVTRRPPDVGAPHWPSRCPRHRKARTGPARGGAARRKSVEARARARSLPRPGHAPALHPPTGSPRVQSVELFAPAGPRPLPATCPAPGRRRRRRAESASRDDWPRLFLSVPY